MAHPTRLGGYAGLVAAVSMAFTPAQAHAAETTPQATLGYATAVHAQFAGQSGSPFSASTYNAEAETAEWRRRGWGWRRGWRRHRRGVRAGDVLAGVLVLGGIAAIASAASNNNRRRDREVVVVERDRERDTNYRPENRRTNRSTNSGSGIDNAVSRCLNEIERDVRVDSVDQASRIAQGWVVSGTLFNGSGFTCQIDNSGRISDVDYGGFSSSGSLEGSTYAQRDGQWSDDRYTNARANIGAGRGADAGSQTLAARAQEGNQPLVPLTSDNLPAYPGGPVPGETYSD